MKKLFYLMSIIIFIMSMSVFINQVYAQSISMVIGKYECISNTGCDADHYCDIDTHKCVQLPVCEICPEPLVCSNGEYNLNGVCVACLNNKDCSSDKPLCDIDNQCVGCSTGSHWNGYDCITCPNDKKWDDKTASCVKCTEDSDCEEACNPETNTCQKCVAVDGLKPYWDGKSCVSCVEKDETTPAWNGETCVMCSEKNVNKPVWNDGACVSCAEKDETTPAWKDGACVSCATADSSKPYWNKRTKQCEVCPGTWDATTGICTKVCSANTDALICDDDEFCYFVTVYSKCPGHYGEGTCKKINDFKETAVVDNPQYIASSKPMNWYSAVRFCAKSKSGGVVPGLFSGGFGCPPSTGNNDYCITTEFVELKNEYAGKPVTYGYVWTSTTWSGNSCETYNINMNTGKVNREGAYHYDRYVACK